MGKALRSPFIILLLSLIPFSGFATHLMGGNLRYEYVGLVGGQHRYRIVLITYVNCESGSQVPFPEPQHDIGIYEHDQSNPNADKVHVQTINVNIIDTVKIQPNFPGGCGVGQNTCIRKGVFEGFVDLPTSFDGYHLYFHRCCRNGTINNLANPGDEATSFHAFIPPTLVENSSPSFSDDPVPFICTNDTTSILNTAVDPDGDKLIFSFVDPYSSSTATSTNPNPAPPTPSLGWPIPSVIWGAGYSVNQPFGSGGYAYINGSTGLTEYMIPSQGRWVVAVEIKEYRNGDLVGITRRDLQLLAIDCPNNPAPNLDSQGSGTDTTIEEGDSLCFPIDFYDPNGDSVELVASGQLFDSSNVNPPATINSPVEGDSTVGTQFCWNTACGQGRPLPYQFTVSVTDNGCPPKTTNVVYEVEVTPPEAPSSINGPNPVCEFENNVTYWVDTISGSTYNWNVSGGSISSGAGTDSITVDWGSSGSGTLTVSATNQFGCESSSISRNITINSAPAANAGPDTIICSDDSVTLGGSPTGPPGSSYDWTPGTGLDDPTLENPTASPNSTTQYIVEVTNGPSCKGYDTVTVNIGSPIMDGGPDTSMCIGDSVQMNASGASSYAWSPDSVLTDTTIANPIAFPDTTMDLLVELYDSTSGCLEVDTVRLRVDELPAVNAGNDTSICNNESVTIGGSPTGPTGSNFAWEPSSSLSDTTLANPIANPNSTTEYFVYVDDTNSCKNSDSITVTVAPSPSADAGNNDTICEEDTTQLNGSGGGSYSWTPTSSLSDPTISSPDAFPTTTTSYDLVVTSMNGCTDTSSVTVVVNPLPNVEAGNDTSICIGDSAQFNASGGTSYSWSPTDSLSDPNIPNPIADPSDTTTYYVSVTDSNGCFSEDSIKVTVDMLPTADAGPDQEMCLNDSVQLNGAGGGSYLWQPGQSLSDSVIDDPFARPNDTLDYVLTVMDSNGCRDKDTTTVRVNPLPNADVSNDTSLCINDTIQLNATGGSSYAWTPSKGLSDTSVSDPLVFTDTTREYIVEVTDSNGCKNTDTVLVEALPLPNASAGPDLWLCPGDSTALDGSGGGTYSWTPTADLDDPTIEDPLAYPPDTTDYIVEVTDSNNCTLSDTMTLFVNDNVPTDAGVDTTICQGDTTILGGTPTAPDSSSYSWTPSGSLDDPNASNPAAFPDTTTTYIVTATNDTCTASDTVTVFVNPKPPADAGPNKQFCIGDSVQLNASGGTSYVWMPGSSLSDSTIADPWALPSDTTEYIVTVTDTNGCSAPDTTSVDVNPLPMTTAEPDTAICEGDTIQLTATGGSSYVWSPPSSLINSGTDTPLAHPDTTRKYTVLVTDSNGCENTDSLTITVNKLPNADAGKDTSICIGDSTLLNASGGSGYVWTPSTTLSDPTIAQPWASPTDTTTYVVNVTDTNGCSLEDSVKITVDPLPNVTTEPDTQICIGDSAQLQASGANSYSWTPSNSLTDPGIADPIAFPTDTTDYIVTGVDSNSCSAQDTQRVIVNPLPNVSAGPDQEICRGDTALINGSGASTYVWMPDDSLSNPNIEDPMAYPDTTTDYIVAGTDTNGCVNTDTMTVFVFRIFAEPDTSVCDGGSVQLQAYGPNAVNYNWSPGTWLDDPNVQDPVSTPDSAIQYTVTVTDINGCVDQDSVTIETEPNPMAGLGAEVEPTCEGLRFEFRNLSRRGDEFFWEFDNGETSTEYSPVLTFPYNSSVQADLTVTRNEKCTDTSRFSKTIGPFKDYLDIFIPNVFSPNGDGVNDVFKVEMEGDLTPCSDLKIYNRWGQLMFVTSGRNVTWDGYTSSGVEVSEGTYFYTFIVNGVEYQGRITLLR